MEGGGSLATKCLLIQLETKRALPHRRLLPERRRRWWWRRRWWRRRRRRWWTRKRWWRWSGCKIGHTCIHV